ncbi:putative membrane protein [Campylobacter pinnipediorum subsp. caledonicus]|uniref:hypothetical protein n=1 Tax=Campylobacter pinnipediorum TaxID=1965231 RepID=UPI000995B5A1|nr:hypothetical protein [Campylobacter pinnipediorum]AQW85869.1 putative membrane protein [Campylobacter pinnipediorum subsp. caledonicus]
MLNFFMMIFEFFTFKKGFDIASIALKSLTFAKMLTINLLLTTALLSYFYLLYKVIEFIYTKVNFIINFINNFSYSNDSLISYFISVLKSFGIWSAFVDVYSVFSPIFLIFFSVYSLKISIVVLKNIRETLETLFISKL